VPLSKTEGPPQEYIRGEISPRSIRKIMDVEVETPPKAGGLALLAKKRVCFVLGGAWTVLLVATVLLMIHAAKIENEYASRTPMDCISSGNSVDGVRSWAYEYQGKNYTFLARCSCTSPSTCYVLRSAPKDAIIDWDVPNSRKFAIWSILGVAALWIVLTISFIVLRYCTRQSDKPRGNIQQDLPEESISLPFYALEVPDNLSDLSIDESRRPI
jgi:hypothetical protein